MINRLSLFLVVMTLISCKTQEITTSVNNKNSDSPFTINFKQEIVIGDTYIFNITNNSDDTLIILSPSVARIEKFENNEWRRVKILYCPCGANCIAPPKEKNLLKGQSHKYRWNLKESWCGEKQENGIPETIVKDPLEGIYRIYVDYIFKGKREKIVRQFEVKKNNN